MLIYPKLLRVVCSNTFQMYRTARKRQLSSLRPVKLVSTSKKPQLQGCNTCYSSPGPEFHSLCLTYAPLGLVFVVLAVGNQALNMSFHSYLKETSHISWVHWVFRVSQYQTPSPRRPGLGPGSNPRTCPFQPRPPRGFLCSL